MKAASLRQNEPRRGVATDPALSGKDGPEAGSRDGAGLNWNGYAGLAHHA
jgi:hypothetical protein